ncbi:type I restriction enzyme EcoR124II R protein [Caedimonas varicaedens]|uniref:type I site-specific deoxyribonuclease n=1 Tax=Caedimonas varicaedens TaxID=1629334 RepID=A0A0K8MB00_9PROT|nr:type I restriction enzyme EcoR124II R protein [Caedimonas varicaedens]
MTFYHTIAETPNSTVVAEYMPTDRHSQESQSEEELEQECLLVLQSNGYEYLPLRNNEDLINNLRRQLSRLNNIVFSEAEWNQLLNNYLARKNDPIEEKTKKIQEDPSYNLYRDDGTTKNIHIIDKENIHNNHLQVINQYEALGMRQNRYDISVLVNGLPLLHMEIKRRGVEIREAFNQINRYHVNIG